MNPLAPLLKMSNITKDFPGVRALDRVSFEVKPGEVQALVGENGAGKSTLIKILAGVEKADAGEIYLHDKKTELHSPRHAQNLGISVIYQEFNLVPQLSVSDNIFLGKEFSNRLGLINQKRQKKLSADILSNLGIELNVELPVAKLSLAQQQMVEIAKAVSSEAVILAMDEPSATLTSSELSNLFALIRRLKASGMGVIYISHRLDEVFEIADRLTVLRDGMKIASLRIDEIDRESLIEVMVGRKIGDEFPKRRPAIKDELLKVENLRRDGVIENISFTLRQGEILALTGLVGSGRTEVARTIFGADKLASGEIYLEGKRLKIHSPSDAIKSGISLLSEDRKSEGLILNMNLRQNISLANLSTLTKLGFIKKSAERQTAKEYISNLNIKTPSTEQLVRNLSGGNQQKVVLAKWLFTKAKVLIFDEPTRGIDVGSKVEIYNLINQLAERGLGILMISSELPEVLGMSDRILVMRQGRIVADLPTTEATQAKVMAYAIGAISN